MKRKVIGLIVGSVIFSIFFLVGCTKENEEYKKFITDRVHIYNHIEKEEIVEDTSNTNLKKVHKNKTDFFEIEGVEVVEDTDFAKKFCNSSAAKTVHHGFVGGLLEHTLSVTKICDFYCTQYPILKRDLLLTAAICHDVGKVKELSPFRKTTIQMWGIFWDIS